MGRKKIAENLTAVLSGAAETESPHGGSEFDPAVLGKARAELRALLAVARAAKEAVRVDYEAPRPSPETIAALIHGLNRVDNALARLERAGKEER